MQKIGDSRESNPGPLAPKARIMPLDHYPRCDEYNGDFLVQDPPFGSPVFTLVRSEVKVLRCRDQAKAVPGRSLFEACSVWSVS